MKVSPIKILIERLLELSYTATALSVLHWDQSVNMPERGSSPRAISISHLHGIVHKKILDLDKDSILTKLKGQVDAKKIRGKNATIVSETWRMYDKERRIPEEFVREMSETIARSHAIWSKAKDENNFALFKPVLRKIVELKRKEAEYLGYADSPYDALLDTYEAGMTTKEAERILNDLKDFLVPFIKKIRASKRRIRNDILLGNFPLDTQVRFNKILAEKLGFRFDAGRIDVSSHPFTTTFHPDDVRFTTRYSETDLFPAIGSTIHETGHALYEQGLPAKHFGTPLAESVSLGIHESQSRLWENHVGKSREFWKHLYPSLQKEFPKPFRKLSLDDFYEAINKVEYTPIRTNSDEVTYNLHIIVRFEIEKALIEGSLDFNDLPKIWKAKMKEYFGITITRDDEGILQDVHWSSGYFGYFPTYSFGNLYAAQLYATMEKQIPNLRKKLASGQFHIVRDWLRKHVHIHGKTYTAQELIKKISGEYLNSRYFQDYITKKYTEIYRIK